MSTDDTPTPIPDTSRQTGSRSVAEGARRDALRMAEQLEARARLLAQAAGRPDLAMPRVAHVLRQLERRFAAWADDRTSPADRQADRDDLLKWYREGKRLLEAHPAPIET